jgi:hypothetical protein
MPFFFAEKTLARKLKIAIYKPIILSHEKNSYPSVYAWLLVGLQKQ